MQSLKCGVFFRPGQILEKTEDYGHHLAVSSIFWAMDPSTGLAKSLKDSTHIFASSRAEEFSGDSSMSCMKEYPQTRLMRLPRTLFPS